MFSERAAADELSAIGEVLDEIGFQALELVGIDDVGVLRSGQSGQRARHGDPFATDAPPHTSDCRALSEVETTAPKKSAGGTIQGLRFTPGRRLYNLGVLLGREPRCEQSRFSRPGRTSPFAWVTPLSADRG